MFSVTDNNYRLTLSSGRGPNSYIKKIYEGGESIVHFSTNDSILYPYKDKKKKTKHTNTHKKKERELLGIKNKLTFMLKCLKVKQ